MTVRDRAQTAVSDNRLADEHLADEHVTGTQDPGQPAGASHDARP